MGLELHDDQCIEPEAFMLFTRHTGTDIRRISIVDSNNEAVIPLSKVRQAVSLDFDIRDSRIYWTDVKLKVSIFESFSFILIIPH